MNVSSTIWLTSMNEMISIYRGESTERKTAMEGGKTIQDEMRRVKSGHRNSMAKEVEVIILTF
jgi:hypothetical protein